MNAFAHEPVPAPAPPQSTQRPAEPDMLTIASQSLISPLEGDPFGLLDEAMPAGRLAVVVALLLAALGGAWLLFSV